MVCSNSHNWKVFGNEKNTWEDFKISGDPWIENQHNYWEEYKTYAIHLFNNKRSEHNVCWKSGHWEQVIQTHSTYKEYIQLLAQACSFSKWKILHTVQLNPAKLSSFNYKMKVVCSCNCIILVIERT